MKAILIDPYDRSISEVEYNGDYKQIYDLIDSPSRCFDIARLENGDGIYVDDMGMCDGLKLFTYNDYPLAGKALILGSDEEGDSTPPFVTLEEVKKNVKFSGLVSVGDGRTVIF